ncbi:MAG: hypothetical protein ACREXT_07155, partial [Gammaproteobacteria bacterium]
MDGDKRIVAVLTLSWGVWCALMGGAAQAQPAADTKAAEKPSGDAVEKVVVTARKRSEAMQDVPASGTVLTGKDLDNLVVQDSNDLVRQIPAESNVVSGYASLSDISLRGQGVGRVVGSETTTGIYRNGIFVAGGA